MAEIDAKTVEHLAELARIAVTPAELETLTKNLATILGYIDDLKQVNTEGLPEVSQVTGLANILREDTPVAADEKTHAGLLAAFPSQENGYLKVKGVFEEVDE